MSTNLNPLFSTPFFILQIATRVTDLAAARPGPEEANVIGVAHGVTRHMPDLHAAYGTKEMSAKYIIHGGIASDIHYAMTPAHTHTHFTAEH